MYNIFFQPVANILSIQEKTNKALMRLGIKSIRDLIFYKPLSYNIIDTSSDLNIIKDGALVRIKMVIDKIVNPNIATYRSRNRYSKTYGKSKITPIKIHVSNNTGRIILVFFNRIPEFIYAKLKQNHRYLISGKIERLHGEWQIIHPEFIFKDISLYPVEPVYGLTYGMVQKQLYTYILEAINAVSLSVAKTIDGYKNDDIKNYILKLLAAIKTLHFIGISPDIKSIENATEQASKILSAKELLANQIGIALLKNAESTNNGHSFDVAHSTQKRILSNLGFKLTDAQTHALQEIASEQNSNKQMVKLLQGDVGSGKTLVALFAVVNVVKSGMQSALMAPTDLLSIQHFEFFKHALRDTEINIELLTGSTTIAKRKLLYSKIENGQIDILIGTHALFQYKVQFQNLGFIAIDEQHKFGVKQRLSLVAKANNPDILIMTATPIPRSLAMTLLGNISISQLKSKPQNRLPIITSIFPEHKKNQLIDSLRKKLEISEKIYWVCPLIDQNDTLDTASNDVECSDITTLYNQLNAAYPDKVGMLHGKMKANDKNQIMQEFKDGNIQILVSTTVIEVGIDVLDATLIVIDNAEQFGLAQLHQLRGRVGRGHLQSHCVLLYNNRRCSNIARSRLSIMKNSNDGFYIAEQDLKLRGVGDVLGTKQSGEPEFFFADLGRDLEILLQANQRSLTVIESEFTQLQINFFARNL